MVVETVETLYAKCIDGSNIIWPAVQNAIIEYSAAETIVWPNIVQRFGSKKLSKKKSKNVLLSDTQVCYLFALLVSWEYREGGCVNAFQFVLNNIQANAAESWKKCCDCILTTNLVEVLGGTQLHHDVLSIQTHFLIICLGTSQNLTIHNNWFIVPLLNHVTGPRLLHVMSKRCEESEIKTRSVNIQMQIKEEKNNKSDFVDEIFITNIIDRLLDVIEGIEVNDKNSTSQIEKKRDRNTFEVQDATEIPQVSNSDATLLSQWKFFHRALELLIDLISSCHCKVRSYLVPYLLLIHLPIRCRYAFKKRRDSTLNVQIALARELLEHLVRWIHFPVRIVVNVSENNEEEQFRQEVYKPLSMVELKSIYHRRAGKLQKIVFRYFREVLPDVLFAGVGVLCSSTFFRQYAFKLLKDSDLLELMTKMRLINKQIKTMEPFSRNFLMDILEEYLLIPEDRVEELRTFPLYPTEAMLWNFGLVPSNNPKLLPSYVLSIPKLQSQFVSFSDYLWRNFELMRLESAYDIRADLTDAIRRTRPRVVNKMNEAELVNEESIKGNLGTVFLGWSRFALEFSSAIEIKKVYKPFLGEKHASSVLAEFSIDLTPCGESIRREWDELSEHDVLFLVTIDASTISEIAATSNFETLENRPRGSIRDEDDSTFPSRYGVRIIRGCKVVQVRDSEGNILGSSSSETTGTKRFVTVELDTTQFALDSESTTVLNIYQSFNLVVRRNAKVNNFRSILETIRGLLTGVGSIARVVPSWMQNVLLGQGEPNEAYYKSESVRSYARKTPGVADPDGFLDFGDTFLNEKHLRNCFELSKSIVVKVDDRDSMENEIVDEKIRSNYRIRWSLSSCGNSTILEAVSYPRPSTGKGNAVPFTSMQVEAIRSGLSPGLTLGKYSNLESTVSGFSISNSLTGLLQVIGPPGTGKSDTAVQIVATLYHSFPTQRTVIIAHSNAALNDIFQKVMARGDVEERHLVRLGSGERSLQTDSTHDFSKRGRVAYSLERRRTLLDRVQLLAESLGLSTQQDRGQDGSSAYTCETAESLYGHRIRRLISLFYDRVKGTEISLHQTDVSEFFPFAKFFGTGSNKISIFQAEEFFERIRQIFCELSEYRPFELLRSQRQRADYLITKQARLVAMTCTHAAIARSELIKLGFEYDNLVIEEAGQMMEIENFIPLLLQRGHADAFVTDTTRLKRVCLMGDQFQLGPIITSQSIAKYSNLDQSMFSRLVHSGVPHIQLDRQGRSRPEIAKLYSWRYQNLGNLDHVRTSTEFSLGNAGFAHCFQAIDVADYEGRGEFSPTPFFYQNVGEAEYVVAVFQYMVLIGYPPQSISILTTYAGQKELIKDVISHRCGDGTPLAGVRPLSVSTVDQYQGQQNGIILLSLVRTKTVGHLRDVRRFIVAVSRARLGLYVFCRIDLFSRCHDLNAIMNQFLSKPQKLQLIVGETHPSNRNAEESISPSTVYEIDDVAHMGVLVDKMQHDMVYSLS